MRDGRRGAARNVGQESAWLATLFAGAFVVAALVLASVLGAGRFLVQQRLPVLAGCAAGVLLARLLGRRLAPRFAAVSDVQALALGSCLALASLVAGALASAVPALVSNGMVPDGLFTGAQDAFLGPLRFTVIVGGLPAIALGAVFGVALRRHLKSTDGP